MDNQDVIIPSTQKPKSNFVIVTLIFVGFLLTLSFLYFGYQLTVSQKQKLTPLPIPLESPKAPIDETADWKNYQVLDSNGNLLGIEYKLPSTLTPINPEPNLPLGANRYQRYLLPNGTDFIVYPIGKLGIFSSTFEKLTDVINNYKLKQKTTTLNGKPAIEFYGSLDNQQINTDLLILGQGEKEFRGVISKMDDRSFLYILHFQDKFTPPPNCTYDFPVCTQAPCPPRLNCPSPEDYNFKKDFASDEKLFDQILTTLKFVSASPTATDSYTACGCGCCGEKTPLEKCLYKTKGDDLNKIIEEDQNLKNSSQCATVGCAIGITYKYCD